MSNRDNLMLVNSNDDDDEDDHCWSELELTIVQAQSSTSITIAGCRVATDLKWRAEMKALAAAGRVCMCVYGGGALLPWPRRGVGVRCFSAPGGDYPIRGWNFHNL